MWHLKALVFGICYDAGRLLGLPIPEGYMSIQWAARKLRTIWKIFV